MNKPDRYRRDAYIAATCQGNHRRRNAGNDARLVQILLLVCHACDSVTMAGRCKTEEKMGRREGGGRLTSKCP